jgi:hypothetical protein
MHPAEQLGRAVVVEPRLPVPELGVAREQQRPSAVGEQADHTGVVERLVKGEGERLGRQSTARRSARRWRSDRAGPPWPGSRPASGPNGSSASTPPRPAVGAEPQVALGLRRVQLPEEGLVAWRAEEPDRQATDALGVLEPVPSLEVAHPRARAEYRQPNSRKLDNQTFPRFQPDRSVTSERLDRHDPAGRPSQESLA